MADEVIDNEAFKWLNNNQLSYDIWTKKYRHNNESFEEWLDRVSCKNEKIKELIRQKKFIFGGRILSNRGLNKGSLANCATIGRVPDSIKGIMDVAEKLALSFQAEQGQGLSLSDIRPKGALIKGLYPSEGVVPFMELFNTVTQSIQQGGNRRGALLMALDVWHKDIVDFITIKSNHKKIENANLSVEVDDTFMQYVEKYYENGDKTTVHIKRTYGKDTIEYDVCPVDIYKLICEQAYNHAEPCVLYTNKLFNYNLMEYVEDYKIYSTNACVTGDTKILTDNGWHPINTLIDREVNIWNGYTWSKVCPKVTGNNVPIYKVTFTNGTELKCTGYHKFHLQGGEIKELKDLNAEDKIGKCNYPFLSGPEKTASSEMIEYDKKLFYSLGFFAGDGTFKRETTPLIYLYGDKLNIDESNFINGKWRVDYEDGHRKTLTIQEHKELFSKDFVPNCIYNYKDRLNWLAGLIDSDGTRNSKDGAVCISSVNKEFLYDVRDMLQTLKCTGTVSMMRKAAKKIMPSNNPNIEDKEYDCKECYRLTISAFYIKKLADLGLETHRVNIQCNPNRDASKFITVKSIEKLGIADTVYCFNEPKNHTFLANGILVGNCSEEPLIPNGLCVLSSFNLGTYVVNPFTKTAFFDFSTFEKDIYTVIEAMDDVVEENINKCPLKEQSEVAKKWRNFGIGVMGISDAMVALGIEYGKDDSLDLAYNIMNFLFRNAVMADVELAEKRGSFRGYSSKIWDSAIIHHNFSNEDIEYLKKKDCLRNCSLLSVAPTGSIGTLFGVSTGTEPFFALSYNRKTKSLNGNKDTVYKCDIQALSDYKKITGNNDIPSYFITAQNLHWIQRINMQAMLQLANDTAISSTCNLPNTATLEDVEKLYLYAWKKGCKGMSIYREGTRDPILSTSTGVKDAKMPSEKPILDYVSAYKRDDFGKALAGVTYKKHTACGNLYITINKDKDGNIIEVFTNPSRGGTCKANLNGETRLISAALRAGIKVEEIIDSLKSIQCQSCVYAKAKGTKIDGTSCPDIIAKCIWEDYKSKDKFEAIKEEFSKKQVSQSKQEENTGPKCPNCGKPLIHTGGCVQCECGYSHCE